MNPLKMIVQKHYQERLNSELQDDTRLEALYGSRFWQTPDHDKLTQFCMTAAKSLDTKWAYIVLVHDKGLRIVASNDGDLPQEVALEWSVCPHVVGVGTTLAINNLGDTPVLCDVGSVVAGGVHAYLGVPLLSREGEVLGSFCVVDDRTREWTDPDVRMLTYLGSALVTMHEAGHFKGVVA